MWDKNEGSLTFNKLQTRDAAMLDGESVSLQGKTRGIFLCHTKRYPILHYYYLAGNDWYTYTCPCQIMLCENNACDAVTFIEFYINSYISKHFVIEKF